MLSYSPRSCFNVFCDQNRNFSYTATVISCCGHIPYFDVCCYLYIYYWRWGHKYDTAAAITNNWCPLECLCRKSLSVHHYAPHLKTFVLTKLHFLSYNQKRLNWEYYSSTRRPQTRILNILWLICCHVTHHQH